MPAGSHVIELAAKNLHSGVYLYRIVVDSCGELDDHSAGSPIRQTSNGQAKQVFQQVKKMIVLK
jgi:hypothetical protein